MEVILKASLVKDLQRVTSSALRGKIRTLIEQLEQVQSLQSIRHLKKVQSGMLTWLIVFLLQKFRH